MSPAPGETWRSNTTLDLSCALDRLWPMNLLPEPERIAVARTIGMLVARSRERQGMSRTELGRRVGVSAARIGLLEAGLALPDAAVLESLASALGVDTADLLTLDQEFRPKARG